MAESDEDYILEMRNITKEFPGVKALSDVTLKVRRGEIHAICGENGAGKSTLMNVLSGLYQYGTYSGDIVFDGQVCKFRNLRESETVGIVIIHQELTLSPYLSIAENVFLGNERKRFGVINWRETRAQAAELLRRVGLDENLDTEVRNIGVGKQQMVEIAKALSKDVKLLILDEPTAALNDEDSAKLLNLVQDLRDNHGITSIIITHKLNEIRAVADHTTILRDGQTIETLDMHGDESITEDHMIRSMVGRPLDNRFPKHTSHVGEEVFRIEDWTVYSPDDAARKIVDNASLMLRAGEVVGLAGLMGAGRTEFAMSVFGRSYGANISGRVYLHGREVNTHTIPSSIANGIVYATEDRKRYGLNLVQKVRENISMAGLDKLTRLSVIDVRKETEIAEEYRNDLNIKTPSVEIPVSQLSGGNQQKVVLAKWIYTESEVFIVDEPTRGIDVGAKYEIYAIIDSLADAGKAILVISSELPELIGVCDRIYTLCEGRITGVVDHADATQESLLKLMTQTKATQTEGTAA